MAGISHFWKLVVTNCNPRERGVRVSWLALALSLSGVWFAGMLALPGAARAKTLAEPPAVANIPKNIKRLTRT